MASTLAARIRDAQIEWPPERNTGFIPTDVLNQLTTHEEVSAELRSTNPHLPESRINEYTLSVCSTARRLFALLLFSNKASFVCAFLDEGITDQDLPFRRAYRHMDSVPLTMRDFDLCIAKHDQPKDCAKSDHSGCRIQAMNSWRQRDIKELCRDQWLVQAPVFVNNGTIPHYELDDNTILPYIEDQEGLQDLMRGGYSHVWGVRVHPAHQNVYRSTNPKVNRLIEAFKTKY